MITFAKGVTSGYLPLGGVIVSDRVAEPFWTAPGGPVFRHGATYAGHADLRRRGAREHRDPRARGPDPARRARWRSALLDALQPLADHPAAGEVRGGVGTLAAVDARPRAARARPGGARPPDDGRARGRRAAAPARHAASPSRRR